MIFLRSRKSWLPLLVVVFFLTACTGGGGSPSPGQHFAVSGLVSDEHGSGVGEVSITYAGQVSGVVTTLSNGQYTISGLIGPTTIQASKEGWVFPAPQTVNRASTVNFAGHKKTYALTVNTTGEGTVAETVLSSGQSADYHHGTIVELRAIPAENWCFSHWEGAVSGTDNPATVTVTEAIEVTAVFMRQTFEVSGGVEDENGIGIGAVTISYEGQVSGVVTTFSNGQYTISGLIGPTTIQASKEGWVFPAPQTVNRASTVNFAGHKKTYALTVNTTGEGTVAETVLSSGQSTDYHHGTIVELRAIPAEHWYFSHWEGDLSGRTNPATLTVMEPSTVTAVFSRAVTISGTIKARHNFPRSVVDNPSQVRAGNTTTSIRSSQTQTMGNLDEHEPGELIIGFDASLAEHERMKVLDQLGYEVIARLSILDAYLVKPVEDSLQSTMIRAMSVPGIRYAQPNSRIQPLAVHTPDDVLYPFQWHYPLIRLPQAWSVTTGDSSIRIAVIDSGVKRDHPDLAPRLDHDYGYNFVDLNTNFDDDNGHGTHVAGTIGAVTNNNLGVAGVMWDVDILPIKVMDSEGTGNSWDLAEGVLYAAGLLNELDRPSNPDPADVINLSLGSPGPDDFTRDVIEEVLSSTSAIIVAATGNEGSFVGYPAAYPGVIAVGSVGYNYPRTPNVAWYSNWGPELDLVAPGGNTRDDSDQDNNPDGVLSTAIESEGYLYMEGTSMAAPHVSGVVGLMLSNGIPTDRVAEILRQTSMPLGQSRFDLYYGYGLVNAYWAVNAVDTMRIIVGTRNGDLVNIVAETTINDPQGGDFVLPGIPPGDYQVFAWVDVQAGADRIELGDYFSETDVIRIDGSQDYYVTGVTTEVGLGDHDLNSPLRPRLEYRGQ